MRYYMLIVLVGLLGSSACEGDDPIGLTVLDNRALAEMEIAYQGAQDAISKLKEALEHDEQDDVISFFDSLFHLHFESYVVYNEEFSHSLQSDHFHDGDHGTHLNSGEDHNNVDGHSEEENNDDNHGEDGNIDEGHEDENEGEDHNDDEGHHNSNEHHAEDHEDMDRLMEEHDSLNIH